MCADAFLGLKAAAAAGAQSHLHNGHIQATLQTEKKGTHRLHQGQCKHRHRKAREARGAQHLL